MGPMDSAPPRLAPLRPDESRPDIAPLLSAALETTGGAAHVNGTLAHHPGLFKRYAPFGAKLLAAGHLPPRHREIVILRTAFRCRCAYEWHHHVRIGAETGLERGVIAALGDDEPPETAVSGFERRLVQATDLLLAERTLDDDTYTALAEQYGPDQIVELLLLIGNYAMLAGLLNSLRVAVEEPAATSAPAGP